MPQHPDCNTEWEDFSDETRILACPGCFALDGRTCLGVSHKRHTQGMSTPFTSSLYSHVIFVIIVLFICFCTIYKLFFSLFDILFVVC